MSFLKNILKKKEAKIILVRHGSTDLNNPDKSKDRIRGWIDVPLNAEGINDAEKTAKKLEKEKIDLIYSSDLMRTQKTGKIINEFHHVPMIISNYLRPWHLGIYEGKITKNVLEDLKELTLNEDRVPVGGESFHDFRIRYLTLLKTIMDNAARKNQIVVVCTHFRNLKTTDAWIQKGQPADFSVDKDTMLTDTFSPGEIYEINLHRK